MSESMKEEYPSLAPYQASFVDKILNSTPPKRFYLQAATGTGATSTICKAVAIGLDRKKFKRVLYLGPKSLLEQVKSQIEKTNGDCKCFIIDGRSIKQLAADSDPTSSIWPTDSVCLTSIQFASRTGRDYGILENTWDLVVVDDELRAVLVAASCSI